MAVLETGLLHFISATNWLYVVGRNGVHHKNRRPTKICEILIEILLRKNANVHVKRIDFFKSIASADLQQ